MSASCVPTARTLRSSPRGKCGGPAASFCLHLCSYDQWRSGWGSEGGKDLAAGNCTFFCSFWRIKLLILAGCGLSFLLSLAVEEGLKYGLLRTSKGHLGKKDPLTRTTSSSLLPHMPCFRQFHSSTGEGQSIISLLMKRWTTGRN